MSRRAGLIDAVFAPRCPRATVVAAALERATARRAATTVLVRERDEALPAVLDGLVVLRGRAVGFHTPRDGLRRVVLALADNAGARSVRVDQIVSVMFRDGARMSGLMR